MKVGHPKQHAFAEKILFHPTVVTARTFGSDGLNTILLNGLLSTIGRKKCIKRVKLIGKTWLFHALGEIEIQLCSVKLTRAWSHRIVRKPNTRSAFRAVELVLLNAPAERIKDPIFEVAANLQHVIVVGEFQRIIGKARIAVGPALILKTEPSNRHQMRRELVIHLRV